VRVGEIGTFHVLLQFLGSYLARGDRGVPECLDEVPSVQTGDLGAASLRHETAAVEMVRRSQTDFSVDLLWARSEIVEEGVGEPNGNRHGFGDEIEKLIARAAAPTMIVTDPTVEDPAAFAMEKHLEEFLVQNWAQTELGKLYDIYEEDGELVGRQYGTDTGPIDVLAISKDKKRLLVVELKKGRASDVVVGQILRYMGYVQEELDEDDQSVLGAIIALEDDQRIRRALTMAPSISFYRYEINFKLVRV
jgi:hypothetical protein